MHDWLKSKPQEALEREAQWEHDREKLKNLYSDILWLMGIVTFAAFWVMLAVILINLGVH